VSNSGWRICLSHPHDAEILGGEENAEAPGGFKSGHGRGEKMSSSKNRQWRKDNKVKCGNE